jgi:Fe-Mn family superoxide dismutase
MEDNRRNFLKKSALLGLAGFAHTMVGKENMEVLEKTTTLFPGNDKFTLPPLPYPYDALEPYIDKQTMEIHYTKHHKGYTDKLNTATGIDFNLSDMDKCRQISSDSPGLLRNNLGGYYNHSLFWQLMKPNKDGAANKPSGALSEAINKDFKSFEDFKKEFSEKASKIFGSGWCWLILDEGHKLKVTTTPNQDNPLMRVATERGTPVLGLDVWEHAYYLKYQNKRADYIAGWWNIVNWDKASGLYSAK